MPSVPNRRPWFYRFYEFITGSLCILALALILGLNIYCSTMIYPNWNEHALFFKAGILSGIIVLISAALIAVFAARQLRHIESLLSENNRLFIRLRRALSMILFVEGLYWIICTQFAPLTDQLSCLTAASRLNAGIFMDWAQGEYVAQYQNQNGLIFFEALLLRLFGEDGTVLVLQLLNAALLPVIWRLIADIGAASGLNKTGQLLIHLFGIVFLPMILYTSFVYGTIPGLALALGAVYIELRFIRTGKLSDLILSAALILTACILKQNYIIFLLGMLIHLFCRGIDMHRPILLISSAAFAAVLLLQSILPGFLVKTVYGAEAASPTISPLSYVTMGMQESESGPGWFNWFHIKAQREAGFDAELEKEIALRYMKQAADGFASDPAYALDFFLRKESSMWCDPTFGSVYYIPFRLSAGKDLPVWIQRLTSFKGQCSLAFILRLMLLPVYAGALLFLLLKRREHSNGDSILLLLCFLGTFLFQTFWEAKSQYTLPAAVLLLPAALQGWQKLSLAVASLIKKTSQTDSAHLSLVGCISFVCAVLILLVGRTTGAFASLTTDSELVRASLSIIEGTQQHRLPDGKYMIHPAFDQSQTLSISEKGVSLTDPPEHSLFLLSSGDRYAIRSEDHAIQLHTDQNGLSVISTALEWKASWAISDWNGDGLYNIEDMSGWGYLGVDPKTGHLSIEGNTLNGESTSLLWYILPVS